MSLLNELEELGVNVEEGLERVMDDRDLYEMMLGMFVDAVQDNPVTLEAFDEADLEALIKRVHTLKGVTGNLAMTPLFNAYTKALGLLRDGDAAQAKEVYRGLLPAQEALLACIQRNRA